MWMTIKTKTHWLQPATTQLKTISQYCFVILSHYDPAMFSQHTNQRGKKCQISFRLNQLVTNLLLTTSGHSLEESMYRERAVNSILNTVSRLVFPLLTTYYKQQYLCSYHSSTHPIWKPKTNCTYVTPDITRIIHSHINRTEHAWELCREHIICGKTESIDASRNKMYL